MIATSPSQIAPRLADVVHIRQNGLRSVNVERDLNSQTVIEGYVLTAQARACLARILGGLVDGTHTRAWTLTGPYGSGKSYFGLFLMNLLSKDQPAHTYALDVLAQADPILTQQVIEAAQLNVTHGLFPIPITGYRANLQVCLKHGLEQALQSLVEQPSIRAVLSDVAKWSAETKSRSILQTLQTLITGLTELGYCGILLIFDELGKPLEYSSINLEESDVYLLQEIAELANRTGETPLVFAGILHQAFERYAALLDGVTQREWAKVQGRFEDIAFQEPPNQQMWLLVNALETDPIVAQEIEITLRQEAEQAASGGWCPPMMRVEEFVDLGKHAYPLHPTVMAALPYLFRRLAQNERSIFAFLASHEPFGFQEFLQQNQHPALIRLPDLFDYLSANFQARLYASGRTRTITETLERLSNANGLSALETDLIKTIGLLNWLGEVSPLQAKRSNLLSALQSSRTSEDDIQDALRALQARTQIVYRRFNQTYAIWQGSDVDIEERLQEAQRQLTGAFSLAEEVQKYLPPHPIVARRHSYIKGTLRYFEVVYVDTYTRDHVRLQTGFCADGMVLLCLPSTPNEYSGFADWAQSETFTERPDLVLGIIERTGRLHELLQELRCLHWVRQNTPDLRDDSVARRELQTRIAAIEILIQTDMERTFSLHRLTASSTGRWFHAGYEVTPQTHQSLTHLLSKVCDGLYPDTPHLWNELINRRALSSQGAAARRNLIEAMLKHAEEENLGIIGYPPERSMYESLLKRSGLHSFRHGEWSLGDPPEEDPLHLLSVWETIGRFIFTPPAGPKPVIELFKLIEAAPFGILAGVQPILLCAFLLSHYTETTLYRENSLLPEPGIADWEVLLRRPELFTVAGCRVEGPLQTILDRFGRGLEVEPKVMPVVRSLVRRLRSLPEYAWRTQRLPLEALNLRRTIETAHSPESMLFHELPLALGITPFDETLPDPEAIETFFDRLNVALESLSTSTSRLQTWARDTLLEACDLPAGESGWDLFRKVSLELAPRVSAPALLPLLKRVTETADSQSSVESALAFVANRPLRSWSDGDADRFVAQANGLGQLFKAECNGYLPDSILTEEQQARCRVIAMNLKSVVSTEVGNDPHKLRAALQTLARELAALGQEPSEEKE